MRRAETLVRRADAWLFAPEDPRRLASMRIGLCCLLALRLTITDYGVVGGQPAALFQPVTYMNVFARMPSHEVAAMLQSCGIVAALVAAAGVAVRMSLGLALACSLVLNGMLNSAGRVIVGDALLTLCLVVLVVCGSATADAWSLRRKLRRLPSSGARYGWPIHTAMVTVALAYFFAGFQKLRYSGISWATSDSLRRILYASSDRHAHANDLALFIANRPPLAHAFASGALVLETCFPLVLFVPRLRWLFIPGVVAMHVGIAAAMGLDYSAQWATVLIVFANWPVLVVWLRRARIRVAPPRPVVG